MSKSVNSIISKTESASILQFLKTPPPKEYLPLINLKRSIRRDKIAKLLNVTPAYFYNILSGSKIPSKALHNRIMALIEEIQAEMKISESTLLDTVSGEHGGLN